MHDLQPTSSCCRPSGATAFALKGKQTDQSPAVKPCAGHGVTRDHGAIFAIEAGRPAASALIFRLVETECKAIRAACLIGDLRPDFVAGRPVPMNRAFDKRDGPVCRIFNRSAKRRGIRLADRGNSCRRPRCRRQPTRRPDPHARRRSFRQQIWSFPLMAREPPATFQSLRPTRTQTHSGLHRSRSHARMKEDGRQPAVHSIGKCRFRDAMGRGGR